MTTPHNAPTTRRGEYSIRQVIPAEPGWWSVCAYDVYEGKRIFYKQVRVVAWVVFRERTVTFRRRTLEVVEREDWITGYGALCVQDYATDHKLMFLDVEEAERGSDAIHLGYRRDEQPLDEWLKKAIVCWPELEDLAEPSEPSSPDAPS